jgi:hypothetical protein
MGLFRFRKKTPSPGVPRPRAFVASKKILDPTSTWAVADLGALLFSKKPSFFSQKCAKLTYGKVDYNNSNRSMQYL